MRQFSRLLIPLLSACILGGFSIEAKSALVTYNGYTLDEATNTVSGTEYEWLQWDLTAGMSVDSALAMYSGSGWQLSTNEQMAELFTNFGFTSSLTWDTDENTTQTVTSAFDSAEDILTDAEKQFVALFGNTFSTYSGNAGSSDILEYAAAIFGDDIDGDLLYNSARVNDDYIHGPSGAERDGEASIYSDSFSSSAESSVRGIALVRVIDTNDTPAINSPSLFGLLIFSLLALLVARRRVN